jgi:deoxycytidylate deaminase
MAVAVLAKSQSPFHEKESVGACIVSWETRRVASVGSNGFVDGFSDGYVCCAEFIKIVQ